MEDYAVYSDLFAQHSIRIADMMRILSQNIEAETQMTVTNPKDLFGMVTEILYAVDRSYKYAKDVKEEDDVLLHYSFKDDAKEEMRNLLREEIERYFATKAES
jgi:prephenate dehydrogenase